ncbi:MAG: class I SAM-dependent methyltransferase [Planctomycetes bacterium]|nr:class I SAM-dependent methyltransferase [Planctomycetota bacterium]
MPLGHNQPSIERSPQEHDQDAVLPGSTEEDIAAIVKLIDRFQAPPGAILDMACGSGRHVRALHDQGYTCHGVDIDQRMIAVAEKEDPTAVDNYQCADASTFDRDQSYAVITLLNRSLVCFHSHLQATGLFHSASKLLLPGGLFIIDNCCTPLWMQVKEGLFADGISEDGNEQMLFLPGENRFAWRRGHEVDPDNWHVHENDRLYRLWSLNELMLAAAGAGLASCLVEHDTPFLVLQRPEE